MDATRQFEELMRETIFISIDIDIDIGRDFDIKIFIKFVK